MRTSLCTIAIATLVGCGDNQTPPPTRDRYTGNDAAPLSCVPNLDGRIDARELEPAIDVVVQYLVSPAGKERAVDVVGKLDAGRRTWSFGVDFADDQRLDVVARRLVGKWYATSFPNGEFASAVDAGGAIEGVYRHDDGGVYLLGLASRDDGKERTLLVYDAPVLVLKLPLAPGTKWVSTGTVANGTLRGLPYAGKDVYEVEADAAGKLVLHDFTFEQVHRVRTKVTVSPSAGAATSRRQVSFFAECFGEVVRATSRPDETNPDFTTAAELRRLGQ